MQKEPTFENRIIGYDLIKVVAIFFVVLYHLGSIDYGIILDDVFYYPNVNKLLSSILSSSVPLFFMVNGALVVPKQLNLQSSTKKALRLFTISLFWYVLMLYVIYPMLLNKGLPHKFNWNFYWFLNALAFLYFFGHFLNRMPSFRIFLCILVILCTFVSNLCWDIIILFDNNIVIPSWGHTGLWCSYAVVYYYWGSILAKSSLSIIVSLFCVVFGILFVNFEVVLLSNYHHVIWDSVNSEFPTVGAFLISTGFFSVLKSIEIRSRTITSIIVYLGKNTIGVYLFHFFAIYIVKVYLLDFECINLGVAILLSLAIVFLTAFISALIKKSKIGFILNQ